MSSPVIVEAIRALVDRRDLTRLEAAAAMEAIMSGAATNAQATAILFTSPVYLAGMSSHCWSAAHLATFDPISNRATYSQAGTYFNHRGDPDPRQSVNATNAFSKCNCTSYRTRLPGG